MFFSLVNISIVEEKKWLKQPLYSIVKTTPEISLIIQGKWPFMFFTISVLRFSALAQEDPENYHIFEVGFKTNLKAAKQYAIPPAATVGGNHLNVE